MATYDGEAPVLDTYQAVVSAFSDFLTVAIHTILYERDLYPRPSFLTARKFNYPVRQSRHPKVCKWIQDAVAAVEVEMLKVRNSSQTAWCFLLLLKLLAEISLQYCCWVFVVCKTLLIIYRWWNGFFEGDLD